MPVELTAAAITKAERAIGSFVERSVRKMGKKLLPRIVDKTPVDTGEAKDSWVMHEVGNGFSFVVRIANAQPYAVLLEHGSSSQAPYGMISVSIEELMQR